MFALRLFILFCFTGCFTVSAQSVFFGERNRADSLSVFFDREGLPYPDYFIPDTALANSNGSLFYWYQSHAEAFTTICAENDYFPESIDYTSIHRLSDSIIQRWGRAIDLRSKNAPALAFYVHGFRKRFQENGQDVTSVTEFALLRENLKTYGKPEPFAVNVYWDGTYDCCFSMKHKRNKELFEMYETAVEQARKVGIGFRQLINATNHPRIQLVGHSLGSQVIASALFEPKGTTNLISTPNKPGRAFHISLIAPAIDAEVFYDYYNRTYPVTLADSYALQILFNEDDFALRKKDPKLGLFGPGANRYGKTGLGCNHRHELDKLKKYFAAYFSQSTFETVDKTELGKCHSLRCYTKDQHLKEVSDFLWNGWEK